MHPFHAFPTGLKTGSGKDDYFLSFSRDTFIPAWQVSKARKVPFFRDLTEYIEVPCGRCYECKREKARKWSFRCLFEAFDHKENYFCTFTFDDRHLGDNKLAKKDLQNLFKRIRKSRDFRYFACGEYGENFGRKHYHVLFFGLHLDDLVPLTGGNMPLYRSSFLESVWPFGFVSVGIARPSACGNYIAKYTMKDDHGKGFLLMSRKPGIGFDGMLKEVIKDNPNPAGWKLLSIGDGRGNLVTGSLPRSLRERLGMSADDELTRACAIKTMNKMRACGYKEWQLQELDFIEEFRCNEAKIHIGHEVARNLGQE